MDRLWHYRHYFINAAAFLAATIIKNGTKKGSAILFSSVFENIFGSLLTIGLADFPFPGQVCRFSEKLLSIVLFLNYLDQLIIPYFRPHQLQFFC